MMNVLKICRLVGIPISKASERSSERSSEKLWSKMCTGRGWEAISMFLMENPSERIRKGNKGK